MIRAYLIEAILLGAVVWLIGWGLVRLYFVWCAEASDHHQNSRRVKRDAEDALDDLKHEAERATKRGNSTRKQKD